MCAEETEFLRNFESALATFEQRVKRGGERGVSSAGEGSLQGLFQARNACIVDGWTGGTGGRVGQVRHDRVVVRALRRGDGRLTER